MPEPSAESAPSATWADRGWYLAVEYGVLARERFLRRLPKIRELGRFKELLEPGGAILYRNLFREEQVADAWELLTALRPWHDHLTCYLRGEQVGVKLVQDVLWCAAFLQKERPCLGGGPNAKSLPVGCDGARVLLGPGRWDETGEATRHVLTFSHVDGEGWLRFDREAIASFVLSGERARACPASVLREGPAFADAVADVQVRALGWPLAAELSSEARKQMGKKVLEAEHGFILAEGQPDPDAHAALELRAGQDGPEVRVVPGLGGASIAKRLQLPVALTRVLDDGLRLRGVRIGEDYVRLKGGHYDLEQRFVLSTRLRLAAEDRVEHFAGYDLSTVPRATPEYEQWAQAVLARMRA